MRRLLHFLLTISLALLAACAGPGLRIQDPLQPVLEGVRLTGHRVCADATHGFACPELPARVPSGWMLTPVQVPSTADAKRLHVNRTVTINISTPPKAEL